MKPPLFVQTIFGILGGIGPDPENLCTCGGRPTGYSATTTSGRPRRRTPPDALVTMGAIMGGNVRVGLEDSVYLARGELARSNADQVAKIVRILRELSLEIATPDEARELLALKGAAQTAI